MAEYIEDASKHTGMETEEQEIDLTELLAKLWKCRKTIIKWCIGGAIAGLIVGFSIPKTYTASVMLAPELEQKAGSGISSIASMMGVSLDNSIDAINFQMFPDIVASTPFIFELFDLQVRTKDGKVDTTLLDYMLNHQKSSWWSHVVSFPFKCIGWTMSLFSKDEDRDAGEGTLDMYNLPKKERGVIKYFAENIAVNIDKKTGKTTISLGMQDPLVAATVMDAVTENLKDYMEEYRTSKVRQDVENLSVICEERKADYYRAQQAYAKFADENKSVVLQSVEAERTRLQQEMNLAFQVYSQVATQLEASRIKEQQAKPVFAIVQPVTIPLKQSAPSKSKILVVFVFLAGCCAAGWELWGKEFVYKMKNSLKSKS